MTWQDEMHEAIGKFLSIEGYVTGLYENAYDDGGCETCGTGLEYEVDVYYVTSAGQKSSKTYYGTLVELIKAIT